MERPRILQEMRDVMPRDAILSVDVNITGYGALPHFPCYHPGTYIFSGVSVAMGIGLTGCYRRTGRLSRAESRRAER